MFCAFTIVIVRLVCRSPVHTAGETRVLQAAARRGGSERPSLARLAELDLAEHLIDRRDAHISTSVTRSLPERGSRREQLSRSSRSAVVSAPAFSLGSTSGLPSRHQRQELAAFSSARRAGVTPLSPSQSPAPAARHVVVPDVVMRRLERPAPRPSPPSGAHTTGEAPDSGCDGHRSVRRCAASRDVDLLSASSALSTPTRWRAAH
jgi:hypothetical protein